MGLSSPQFTVMMSLNGGIEAKIKNKQINRIHEKYLVSVLICGMPEIITFCVEQTAGLFCCYVDTPFIKSGLQLRWWKGFSEGMPIC